jgi:hypothetical protein
VLVVNFLTWSSGEESLTFAQEMALQKIVNQTLSSVERLYSKRPILCLASSKILTPPPSSPPGECVPPPPPAFGAGGGHTRWVERGWGVNILKDARHCSVLYIRKYFVLSRLHQQRRHSPTSLTPTCPPTFLSHMCNSCWQQTVNY